MKRIAGILESEGLNGNHSSFVKDIEKRKRILGKLKILYEEPKYAKHGFWTATRDFLDAMVHDTRNPNMEDLQSFVVNDL